MHLKEHEAEYAHLSMPSVITLSISKEELEVTGKNRIQNRIIKSVRLGELSIDYETGTTADGIRIAPNELKLYVASGMTFAYDTIVFITLLRYIHLMQREEIQSKILKDHYFKISTGSISELSFMGLAYLERCHFARAKKLFALYGKGCFFIHLDGTNEGGMYNHFVVREGIRGNVLYAEKIISESEDSIKPILKKIKKYFGVPDAIVSDMSPPIAKAVKAVFKDVPHRLCHYHFLKAVGKSLLENTNHPQHISLKSMKKMLMSNRKELVDKLRSCKNEKHLENGKLLLSLIDYINDYSKDLNGEGFPFDLPVLAFYNRCETAFNMMENIFSGPKKDIPKKFISIMMFIRNRLHEYFLYSHISQLKKINDLFMELRNILHPQREKGKTPLNWGMINSDIKPVDIQEKLDDLYVRASRNAKGKDAKYLLKAWRIICSRLKKYKDKLNPIIEFNGGEFILPRTNNMCETGFRDCKRKARRTTGDRHLSNHMDNLPPQYFYTVNLSDPGYIKAIFGDGEICDSFHKIDKDSVRADVEKMKIQRVSPKAIDYKLIRSEDYLDMLAKHFTGTKKCFDDLSLKKAG